MFCWSFFCLLFGLFCLLILLVYLGFSSLFILKDSRNCLSDIQNMFVIMLLARAFQI